MAAVQLSFALRTSSHCKTVHLLGSWDTYKNLLPLSKDSTKSGGWKGTFRFQGATLKPGQRYWYYYIVDGYHVSHDPSQPSMTEATTGRKLNILDVPHKGAAPRIDTAVAAPREKRNSRHSPNVPQGRALSPSQIKSPRPVNPTALKYITATDFTGHDSVKNLAQQFSRQRISTYSSDSSSDIASDSSSDIDSDVGSDVPSLSSRSSGSSSNSDTNSARSTPSSCSSGSCTCERYGITRKGDRVKLDCGGSRCGFSSDSCSSDSEEEVYRITNTRRQGMVVRGPPIEHRRR